MEIIKKPNKIHGAFDPIIFEVAHKGRVELWVKTGDDNLTSLARDSMNGKVVFNLSPVVANFFGGEEKPIGTIEGKDVLFAAPETAIGYAVLIAAGGTEVEFHFTAVRTATEIGGECELPYLGGGFLTDAKEIPFVEGQRLTLYLAEDSILNRNEKEVNLDKRGFAQLNTKEGLVRLLGLKNLAPLNHGDWKEGTTMYDDWYGEVNGAGLNISNINPIAVEAGVEYTIGVNSAYVARLYFLDKDGSQEIDDAPHFAPSSKITFTVPSSVSLLGIGIRAAKGGMLPSDLEKTEIKLTGKPEELQSIKILPLACDPLLTLRWINKYGGVDYWAFTSKTRTTTRLNKTNTYEPYLLSACNATADEIPYSMEAGRTITTGEEHLRENDFKVLSGLLLSPKIEYLKNGKWVQIHLKSGEVIDDSSDQTKAIEFEFVIPKPRLQL